MRCLSRSANGPTGEAERQCMKTDLYGRRPHRPYRPWRPRRDRRRVCLGTSVRPPSVMTASRKRPSQPGPDREALAHRADHPDPYGRWPT
jgi:hypothetical protein